MNLYSFKSGVSSAALLLGLFAIQPFLDIRGVYAQEIGALEEIVVTARKREESLQDTPVSITAFTGESLKARGIERLDGIAAATPNLAIDSSTFLSASNAAAGVFIRGIGQVDFTLTTEPGVGVYLDGVYISSSIGSLLDLIDIERVEVLRGPQGTLFGRNTIGGAINVTTRRPDEELHGDIKLTTGAYDRLDVQGSINIPINEVLFAKVSAATFNRDGFVDAPNTPKGDDLGNVNRDAGRIALRFAPNDRFEADFSADFTRVREDGVPHVRVGSFEGASLALIGALANPASPAFVPPPAPLPPPSFIDLFNILAVTPLGEQGGIAGLFPGVVPNPLFGQPLLGQGDVLDIEEDGLRNPSRMDLVSETDTWGVALNLNYDFDRFSIRSITSYRSMEAFTAFDFGAVQQTVAQFMDDFDTDQFSQEIQLSGQAFDARLNWLLGFYHFEEDGVNLNDVEFTAVHVLSGAKIDNRSTAGFAQATFDVTDRLALTAGLRYTDERKEFIVPDTCFDLPKGPQTLFDGSVVTCARLQSVIDPKFVNAGFLTFVNAPVFPAPGGRFCCLPISDAAGNIVGLVPGLESGDDLVPQGTTARSFSDWTPHASIKYQWTDDLMTYFAYSQGFKSGGFVQRVFPPKTEVPSFAPETATVYEIGLKWSGMNDRLSVAAAGFHTDYDDLQIQVNDGVAPVTRNAAAAEIDGAELEISAIPAPGWLVQGGVGYLDAEYTELDPSENFTTDLQFITLESGLVNAPKWSTNLGLQYSRRLTIGGQLTTRLDWSWRSKAYKDALNFPQLTQEGYHMLDLSMNYVTADGNWEVTVFGKNVTDESYVVTGHANGLTQGWATAVVGRPAEWGVSLAYHFN